jgi:5-methylcytosine-specific restriction endonuclease McrA
MLFPRSEYFFNKIKTIILFIYDFRCVLCGLFSISNHIHHIDKKHLNNDPYNLTCLCDKCHLMVHSRFQVKYPGLTSEQVALKDRLSVVFGVSTM